MTAGKLIKLLKVFPSNVPVVAEWEGGWSNLESPGLTADIKGNPVVVFDVDEHGNYSEDIP